MATLLQWQACHSQSHTTRGVVRSVFGRLCVCVCVCVPVCVSVVGQWKKEGDGKPKESIWVSLSVLQSSEIEELKWRLDAVPESQVTKKTQRSSSKWEEGRKESKNAKERKKRLFRGDACLFFFWQAMRKQPREYWFDSGHVKKKNPGVNLDPCILKCSRE